MRNEAIRHYEHYNRQLESELGMQPRDDTGALIEDLRKGRILAEAPEELLSREADLLEADIGVVVFPFLDLSADASNAHFCDGLTEEIISALGTVERLRVTPRTSAFALSGAQVGVREAAHRLGVTHAVEGSASFDGNRYRVTVRLLDADSEEAIWESRFKGSLETGDLFELEEDIATSVRGALDTRLAPDSKPEGEREQATRVVRVPHHQTEPAAYAAYLRGRHAWFTRTAGGFNEALLAFAECIRLDPEYARAHAAIADAYNLLGAFDYAAMPPTEAYPKALEAARTALGLEPNLAQGHAALGNTLMSYEGDHAGAEEAFRTAIELDPGYSSARQWYSTLLMIRGSDDEALSQATLALELDPWSSFLAGNLGTIFRFLREPERAAEQFRHSIRISREFIHGYLGLAVSEVQGGRPLDGLRVLDEVRSHVSDPILLLDALRGLALAKAGELAKARRVVQALKASPAEYVPAEYVGLVYLGMGELQRSLTWLERAKEERSQVISILAIEPLLEPLRSEPRFKALLE